MSHTDDVGLPDHAIYTWGLFILVGVGIATAMIWQHAPFLVIAAIRLIYPFAGNHA